VGLAVISVSSSFTCRVISTSAITFTTMVLEQADHRGAQYRYFDPSFISHIGDGLLQWIKVHDHPVDPAPMLFVPRCDMLSLSARQKAPCHNGVKCFDSSSIILRESGNLGYVLDRRPASRRFGRCAGLLAKFGPPMRAEAPAPSSTDRLLSDIREERAGTGRVRHQGGSWSSLYIWIVER